MDIIADLHLHSKYSRAVSRQMDLPFLVDWARRKGVKILGTGDFTHPFWFSNLKNNLQEVKPGLFQYTSQPNEIYFILSAEISLVYSQNGRGHRIHHVVLAPSLAAVEKINDRLSRVGNLTADGRPILGLNSRDFTEILLNCDPRVMIIPAHMWTPWFSLFGSSSGFDKIEDCFGDMSSYIQAGETGLSSDPAMNWRLSSLDNLSLVSFSDAHSPANLMREAIIFNVAEPEDLSYDLIIKMISEAAPNKLAGRSRENYLTSTIEFFPEEGKYHFDGHRSCGVVWHPKESQKYNYLCSGCGRPVTIGVMSRVEKLADRPFAGQPAKTVPYTSLVQLNQIIAETLGQGRNTKAVQEKYELLISRFGSEYQILANLPLVELAHRGLEAKIVDGLRRVRQKEIVIRPGYDGEYGIVKVWPDGEMAGRQRRIGAAGQQSLFES